MNAFDLSGKTAIVTGGGSGIGLEISRRLAAHGAHVEILDINTDGGQEAVARIIAEGGSAHCLACDVSSAASVEACVNEVVERRGRIDILVNNAGIASVGNLGATSEEELDRIYGVNVKGVFNGMKACIDAMVGGGGGVILNLASIASNVGIPDRFAYSMSKGAVLMMTLSVARDYIDKGIRCNCVCPARVHTPFVDAFIKKNYPGREDEMFDNLSKTQPIGRMGRPDEVAALALYLCSDEAGFVTGGVYEIDGGFTNLR